MIHKEGYFSLILGFVACCLVITLTAIFLNPRAIVLSIELAVCGFFMVMLVQFFRNPARLTISEENDIISPADGTIVVLEETMEKEYFNDSRIQLSVFMSPLNVHVNRNPVGGKIEYLKYHPGKFLVAWHPKSSSDNERTTVVYKTLSGNKLMLRQIAGAMARRIVYYITKGNTVIQGEEMGFIKFGSRVDLLLPHNCTVCVEIGQKVIGGITLLARFQKTGQRNPDLT